MHRAPEPNSRIYLFKTANSLPASSYCSPQSSHDQDYLTRRCISHTRRPFFFPVLDFSTVGTAAAVPVPKNTRHWNHLAESFPKTESFAVDTIFWLSSNRAWETAPGRCDGHRPTRNTARPIFNDMAKEGYRTPGAIYEYDVSVRWCPSCLLYTSPSPRDKRQSRMPSSA